MDNRNISIIKILSSTNGTLPITAAKLAASLGCSVRTIKSCIATINAEYSNIIASSTKGYTIPKSMGEQLLSETFQVVPQTPAERVSYLSVRLIKSPIPLPVDILCDELCISDSTLFSTLKRVEKQIEEYDLSLQNHKDSIQIAGDEKNKRRLISSTLYAESDSRFVNLDTIQEAFPNLDVAYISDTLHSLLEEEHYFINDYSLINLTLHLAIAIDRIQNSLTIQESPDSDVNHSHPEELSVANRIVQKLQLHFNIAFSPNEIHEITLLILSRTTPLDSNTIGAADLEAYIGSETLQLVYQLLNELQSDFEIDLKESDFYVRFALHINNLLLRSKYHHLNRNPLTTSVKNSCPLLYDVATQLAGTIYSETGILINDDEIAYIAFHLGSAFETKKLMETKIKVILLCPTYYDMGSHLRDALSQHFGEDIIITHVATTKSELKEMPVPDFLLTTLPLDSLSDIPMLQIHPFLASIDFAMIRRKIQQLKLKKLQSDFHQNLSSLISSSFFERTDEYKTRDEVIHHMTSILQANGYVDHEFDSYVLKRDQISSTAFYDYAIPHTMKMRAQNSAIYVLISESPIHWNDIQQVHLVMLLCFSKKEQNLFNETFEPLSMVLTNNLNVKKLLSCKSKEEFIDFICNSPDAFPLT